MIAGWVDWSRLPSRSPELRVRDAAGSIRSITAPGLDLAVSEPRVDVAIRGSTLAIASGAPRFLRSEPARVAREQGIAHGWLANLAAGGDQGAAEVHGRYSVIAIDLAEHQAVLATDRFAVWPLCYAVEGSRLAFSDRADEVPAAAAKEFDPQAIFDYLYYHVIPAPRTVFRGIRRLEAAQTLVFDHRGPKLRAHWVPQFEEASRRDFAALRGEFRKLLEDAVAREAAGGDLGCFLSGGTDSSTIAGLVGQVTGRRARTFTIGFDTEGYDESSYARIAARHFDTEHHEYYLKPDDLLDGIPRIAAHFDQPFGNSSALPAYYCTRIARDAGVRTMLAGDGGDELFGGNVRYARQRVFAAYELLPAALRRGVVEPVLLDAPLARRLPFVRKAASYIAQARVPMPERLNTYNLLTRLGVSEVLDPDFLAAVEPGRVDSEQREAYERCGASSLINRLLAFDWKYTLADNDLHKVRGSAQLAGLAVRFPLLDDTLVDFALRLAPDLKLRGLKLRYFFKEALRDFLPAATLSKTKHGFGLPIGVWLARDARLRTLAQETLASLGTRAWIRGGFLDRLVTERLLEHPAYYGEMVWVLTMLEQWMMAHPLPSLTRERLHA